MHVALSNSSYKWGGVHRITESLGDGLRDRGHAVTILCRPRSLLHERLRDRFDCRPVVRGGDFNPATLLRVTRVLRQVKPDLVLTMMDKDLRLAGPAARALGIPVVARRANDQPLRAGPYARLIYGRVPALHIANSHATRATMLASAPWLDEERVVVIHNGIAPEPYATAQPADLPLAGVLVAFIARLERRKGLADLLEAWPLVSARTSAAQLIIVGRGAMDAEVKQRALALERVHVLGYRTDVAALLRRSDIVVVPSHWEGFGLIAAEAMAAARPVIAANASSLPEIVRHGIDGLLVPPRAPAALAAAILQLVEDPAARTRMGAHGQERVTTTFTVERMVDQYVDLLNGLARPQG